MKVPERKFMFGCFVLFVSTAIFVFTVKLTGDQWVDLIKWIGVSYFLANVGSKVMDKINGTTEIK
jgi:threonine/homoserine/homoserine lactone efflux protein